MGRTRDENGNYVAEVVGGPNDGGEFFTKDSREGEWSESERQLRRTKQDEPAGWVVPRGRVLK